MPDETNAHARIEQPLDDVLAHYIAGEEAGSAPDRQALLARHPGLAGELREFFANRDQMQRLAQPLRGGAEVARAGNHPLGKVRYFGDYELLEEVAAGGMGIIYKARQRSLNRIVAVKMILKGTLAREDDVKRFRAEAEAAASLQHPAIVAIHEVGLHEGQHYFSMDFVDGHSLAELPRERPLSAHQAAEYIRDAAEAVHYAHQQGTLHRDLKPSNLLIDRQGRVRITDFGLAKRIEGNSDLTLTGQILGTPSYMPPEQATSKRSLVGVASDIYSLGAVLYELLTGRPPFRGESPAETLRQVESMEPVSPRLLNPATPRDLETICLKCLEKEPHKRYGTAQLLADDLGRYLRGEPILARPISRAARAWRWCKRNPATSTLMASLLLVFSLGFMGVMSQWIRAESEWSRAENNAVLIANEAAKARHQAEKAILEMQRAEDALHQLQAEQQRTHSLQSSINDLEARRQRLRENLETEQRRLSQTYVRLAGMLMKTGEHVVAGRFLEQCPEEHRSFEWNYYQSQLHPVFQSIAMAELAALKSSDLKLTLRGMETTFTRTTEETPVPEKLLDAVEAAVARTLDSSLSSLPPGSVVATTRTSNASNGLVAIGLHWQDWRKKGDMDRIVVASIATGDVERILPWNGKPVEVLAFSGDGKWLACADAQKMAVWETALEAQGLAIGGHRGDVYRIAMSPDKTHMASVRGYTHGSASHLPIEEPDGVKIWNLATGEQVCCFGGVAASQQHMHFSVAFDPQGTQVAAIGRSGAKVWNLADRREIASFQRPGHDLALNSRGWLYSTGPHQTSIWRIDSQELILEVSEGGTGIAMNPQETQVAVACGKEKKVIIFEADTLRKLHEISTRACANRLRFSPSGAQLAVAEGYGQTELVQVFNAETAEELLTFTTGAGEYAFDVDYSPDGSLLATANAEAVYVWDALTGQNVLRLKVPNSNYTARLTRGDNRRARTATVAHRAYSVAFSPDGKRLAAGWGPLRDGNIIVWNTTLGEQVPSRQWIERATTTIPPVGSAAISPSKAIE